MKEQRKHRRLHLQLPLRVHGTDKNGQEIRFNTSTENVSTGGAYFLTSTPVDKDLKVNVFLSVPYEVSNVYPPKTLEAEASVVRVSTPDDRQNGQIGIAIKFLRDLSWKRDLPENV